MRSVSLALLCLLVAGAGGPIIAQTTTVATPTSVDILVLPATGDKDTVAPIATRNTPISATAAVCNQAALSGPAPTSAVNPSGASFNDPFNSGKTCRVPLPVNLPDGTGYRLVGVLNGTCKTTSGTAVCSAPRSDVGVPSFSIVSIQTAPAKLSGLTLIP